MLLNNLFKEWGIVIPPEIKKLVINSQELDENTAWLAVKTPNRHALDYYSEELKAALIIYEPPYENPPQGAVALENLSNKLGELSNFYFDEPSKKLRLFGITGTDGKSSLVYFLGQALNAAIIGTIGNGFINNLQTSQNTTPNAYDLHKLLANFVEQGAEIAAMEVSSHSLVENRVGGVKFDTVLFTNLSRDHLDFHKDMEDYFQAKALLFKKDIKNAVINIDDEYGRRLIKENLINPNAEIWTVSSKGEEKLEKQHLHLKAEEIDLSPSGINFVLNFEGERVAVKTKLLARFNVDNLLNVATCLLVLGKTLNEVALILENLNGVIGRVEKIDLGEGKVALIDYAHTAGAIESVLKGIRPHIQGKLSILFGCGGNRDKGKRPLMAAAAEKFADEVIVSDDNPRNEDPEDIIEDIMQGFENPQKVKKISPREDAIVYALNKLESGDALLIAGKGHENYQIIGNVKYHFSDAEIVKRWLNKSS